MTKIMIWGALGVAFLLGNHGEMAHAQETVRTEAKPLLHPLFSDNAVLQRDRPLPIWGWTQPESSVEVEFDAQKQTARAGDDGRWTISLPSHAAGGPHSLSVTSATGNSVTRKNLLFGDVWLCGGQSNMAYDLYGAKNPEAEIAAANYPNIRLLQVPNAITATPLQSFEGGGGWQMCSPQTVAKFSAVAYFFGRKLYNELNVPIGLINSSWSGTPGQSWVSGPALAQMPEFKPAVDALQQSAKVQGDSAKQMEAWWQTNDPGSLAHQEAPAFDDSNWKSIDEPGPWEDKGFADFDGVMWFRRVVDVPPQWAGRDLQLHLGSIDDNDTTFWNGMDVGETAGWDKPRNYTIPGAQVKAGRNVIAVRVLDTGGGGGLAGPALSLQSGADTVSLAGAWKLHQGPALSALAPMPRPLDNPNAPVVLFNGKISPLLPGEIKGILWYQGESNADRMDQAIQYRTLLPILINDWRAHFGAQTPFYIMQLANFKAPDDSPNDNPWPRLREAQLLAARNLPNTYLTVLIDLGEEKNVHFPNKQEAGARLASNVLEHTYGKNIESSGPTLKDGKRLSGAIQLSFDHAQGLNLKGDQNHVFAVAGNDLEFFWATPQIAGDVVTLRSADVPTPLYARFGWSDNPRAVLYNAAGLPASPFRTDGDTRFPVALAQNTADAAFDAWNAAFLVRSNGQTYYSRTLSDRGVESEGSWVFALDIETAEDAYERTRSPLHLRLVNDLLNGFLAQNNGNWADNTWNDDMGWMSLALVRGYQITGNKAFLDKAIYAWNLAYDRGWDTKYGGGGVWENMDNFVHGDGKADKLALSNDPFVNSGVTLYQITGDPAYLTKAKAMYGWVRDNVFDKTSGQVNEGVKWPIGKPDGGWLENSANVYNSGSFIEAANQLHRITGDPMYYNDAQLAINFVINKTPVLNNNGGFQNQWGYRFIKGLNQFATDNNQWPQYETWMRNNAKSAWSKRNDLNLTGNNWLQVNQPTPQAAGHFAVVSSWLKQLEL